MKNNGVQVYYDPVTKLCDLYEELTPEQQREFTNRRMEIELDRTQGEYKRWLRQRQEIVTARPNGV